METLKNYRIDSDLFTNYVASRMINEDSPEATEKELINHVADCLKNEYLFSQNIQRYKTVKNCLIEWLKGLPSCLNIEYTYFEITNIFKAMETEEASIEDMTEEENIIAMDRYWVLIAESLNNIHYKHYRVRIY